MENVEGCEDLFTNWEVFGLDIADEDVQNDEGQVVRECLEGNQRPNLLRSELVACAEDDNESTEE